MPLISVEEAQAMLPQVGDRLRLAPTLHKGLGNCSSLPQPCRVVYVNKAHLWYMVQFEKTNIVECFRVPETEHSAQGRRCTDD